MNKLKSFIYAAMVFVFLLAVFLPCFYWFNNPELTQMQVFKKFWGLYISGVIFGGVLIFKIINNHE